ncbi:MAG: phosphate signaling complex protein PhoU [Gammaproteobacteria bacterium]|nr:phosphate signaling complex protein PhoU [Gammaproteobacteria bacterium]
MDAADLGQHISKRYNEELERLRNGVLSMGGLVESQLESAVQAVVVGDSELGLRVARDDYKVNRMEVTIDEACSRILATRQPAASDLRLIVAIIKTITDLERIGDEAEKIGFLASRLASMERPSDRYRELKTLGDHVQLMVHNSLDAFARLDAKAALATVKLDDQVDDEYDSITRQCITFMMEDPRTISRVMNVTWVARALERIGDHAKNICEYVIYMVHGKDVRHTDSEAIEREVIKGGKA